MQIDPSQQALQENYKLLIGSILPRPIAFVSTCSKNGIANLAPFSFFTGITADPPTVCFSILHRFSDGKEKDTLQNIRETKEFVINSVSMDIVEKVNNCAVEFAPEINEFAECGFTQIQGERVNVARVAEAAISMECELLQLIDIGNPGAGGGTLVIGEVKLFHIQSDLLDKGRINTAKMKSVGRLAGSDYIEVKEFFNVQRKH
jgi:flavin reductase (DIM6/NTAB) family NADH-FMN oxidoreductase RutF